MGRRCDACGRRLHLAEAVTSVCRCTEVVCPRCRDDHACTHDHRATAQARLAAVPAVAPPKVDHI